MEEKQPCHPPRRRWLRQPPSCPPNADVTLLYARSNAETTTPHLHDGRGKEMDQQLICELNLALIPVTELASRHITFAVVSSLRGNLLLERDPACRPR